MSYLERAFQVIDVPYPCLTCGTNLSEGVLYCPPCWAQKQADREARRVLAFDPNRRPRTPTVRDAITGSRVVEGPVGADSHEPAERALPTPCLSGPVSNPGQPSRGPR